MTNAFTCVRKVSKGSSSAGRMKAYRGRRAAAEIPAGVTSSVVCTMKRVKKEAKQ